MQKNAIGQAKQHGVPVHQSKAPHIQATTKADISDEPLGGQLLCHQTQYYNATAMY